MVAWSEGVSWKARVLLVILDCVGGLEGVVEGVVQGVAGGV